LYYYGNDHSVLTAIIKSLFYFFVCFNKILDSVILEIISASLITLSDLPCTKLQTRCPAVARVGQLYHIYWKADRENEAIFQSDCSPIHTIMMLLYQTIQSVLRYDTVFREFRAHG